MRALLALLAAGVLCAAVSLAAHHSFAAEYDADKSITLKGSVTKIEWTNPHARFYIDVKNPDGSATNWNLELSSPNVLNRNGWTRTSLHIGDQVTVEGSLARDGSKMANALAVTLANGRRVFSREPGAEAR